MRLFVLTCGVLLATGGTAGAQETGRAYDPYRGSSFDYRVREEPKASASDDFYSRLQQRRESDREVDIFSRSGNGDVVGRGRLESDGTIIDDATGRRLGIAR